MNNYKQIYVDVTLDCNLSCNVCYTGEKKKEYIDINYFESICKNLPNKVIIRLVGGEPTIHPEIFEIIQIVKKYKHIASLASNGITFNNLEWVKELHKVNPLLLINISVDGGMNNKNAYHIISGKDLTNIKMNAIENINLVGFKRMSLGMLLVKNLNENVIDDLLELQKKFKNVRYLFIRNLIKTGRYPENIESYDFEEMRLLVSSKIKKEIISEKFRCDSCYKCNSCKIYEIKNCQVGIGFHKNSINCSFRGKLENNGKITSCFRSLYD